MKTQFHIRGLNVNAGFRHWLEQPLERLQSLISVSSAAVVVEYERHSAPAFRTFALLAVPGPDIHAEARDHTLQAAWLKVITALRRQIGLRKARQETRMKRSASPRATMPRKRNAAGLRS